jgi:Protein of unknown function (DUF1499)
MLSRWITGIAGGASVLLVLAIAFAMLATRYEFVGKLAGFSALMMLAEVALIVAALGALGVVVALCKRRAMQGRAAPIIAALLALGIGGGYAAFVERWMAAADEIPLLHDISTHLSDPPQFTKLALRKDNLKGVASTEAWAQRHREGYPEIKTVASQLPAPQLWSIANTLVQSRGWVVARSDASTLEIEAIDHTSFLRFRDNVVIRVRAQGAGSELDIRSVSEVGTSDLGINAKRIRVFIAELKK